MFLGHCQVAQVKNKKHVAAEMCLRRVPGKYSDVCFSSRDTLPLKSLGSRRQFGVFHENSHYYHMNRKYSQDIEKVGSNDFYCKY